MKTSLDVGARLQEARTTRKVRMKDLVDKTGLTAVTLRRALDGTTDARISTVLAIAHELGLELVLLPRQIAASLEDRPTPGPQIESIVARALRERP